MVGETSRGNIHLPPLSYTAQIPEIDALQPDVYFQVGACLLIFSVKIRGLNGCIIPSVPLAGFKLRACHS